MPAIKWKKRKKTTSPTPWRLVDKIIGDVPVTSIAAADGTDVVFNINSTEIDLDQARANAKKIIKAVNSMYPPKKKAANSMYPPKKKYGIKAYGDWKYFNSKAEFKNYLMDWISATEGAERNRAVQALSNLEAGIAMTDTDQPEF